MGKSSVKKHLGGALAPTPRFGFRALGGFELENARDLNCPRALPIGSTVVPFWGLPYRILNTNHKKELLWSPWVDPKQLVERCGLEQHPLVEP